MRQIDADALKEDLTRFYAGEVTARDLIDKQPTIGGWISVKDRLPESDEEVLVAVYDSDGQAYHTIAVHYPCGGWDSDDDYFNMNEDEVMYCMPLPTLPEPPEEVSGDE